MRYLSDPLPEFNPPIGEIPETLWELRRWGVKVRNALPTTTDQMAEWKAGYLAWREKMLAALLSENHDAHAHIETLNEIGHAPLNDFWCSDHELLARCLSEELRRLEAYLVKKIDHPHYYLPGEGRL